MDRGAWQATVMGSQRLGYDLVTEKKLKTMPDTDFLRRSWLQLGQILHSLISGSDRPSPMPVRHPCLCI